MAPSRQPHDPFTDAPLRPTTSNATSNPALRNQASQQSLRSNASAASSRPRGQGSLFAPNLSRRPTGRCTPRVDDGILADSDSENERTVPRQHRRPRRVRHGSPEAKHVKAKSKQEEEAEFVNRQPDGSYLLGVPGVGETVAVPQMMVPKSEDEIEQEEVDAHYNAISRQYFASGAALGGRSSKKHEEELEQLRLPMMLRLREQVTEKLEGERWQYEPVDRFHVAL